MSNIKTFTWINWLNEEFSHYPKETMERIKTEIEQKFQPNYVLTFYEMNMQELDSLQRWIDENIKNNYYAYTKDEYIFEDKNDVVLIKTRWC